MPTLTGEGQEVFMSAVLALHTGKTVMEDAAIQITLDDLLHIGTEEVVFRCESLVIDLLKLLDVILDSEGQEYGGIHPSERRTRLNP
jgi:hypothetical protein